jgi:hypothetical protein
MYTGEMKGRNERAALYSEFYEFPCPATTFGSTATTATRFPLPHDARLPQITATSSPLPDVPRSENKKIRLSPRSFRTSMTYIVVTQAPLGAPTV